MGLKPIRSVDDNGCRADANIWFKLSHDLWFNYALMRFQASAYARCPEPHHLKGHWNCLGCPRDMNQTQRERESEREREGERDSDRQTDRETIRQTDRQRIRQTERIR